MLQHKCLTLPDHRVVRPAHHNTFVGIRTWRIGRVPIAPECSEIRTTNWEPA